MATAVTKENLDEYTDLETKASKLEREAKTFRDRQSQLEQLFEEDLKDSKKPSLIRHGFTFAWVNGGATVKWADEFLRECGPEKTNELKVAAAEKATASKLKILPPVKA